MNKECDTQLVIAGAGGFGRETLEWAMQCKECGDQWSIAGFIDDNPAALDGFECSHKVIGTIADWRPKPNERFVVAMGTPSVAKSVAGGLAAKGAVFTNIIHPTVTLASSARLGEGLILCPRVTVSANARIGNHVIVNIASSLGHDVVVGDYSIFSSFCDITGGVMVGEGVFFGSSVSVVPQRTIGDGAFICAGSVVMNNVPAETRVMGVPAKKFQIRQT